MIEDALAKIGGIFLMKKATLPRRGFRRLYRLVSPALNRFSTFMPETTLSQARPRKAFERNDNLIIDLGMNDGADTFYYLKKNFNVVAVEANPMLVSKASRLLDRFVRADRLRIINQGITDKASDEPLDFFINLRRSEFSSFVREIGCRDGSPFRVVKIKALPVSELFREFGTPYYIKIDIEGLDHRVVEAIGETPLRPRFISVEESGVGIIDALARIGARGFKLVSQNNHPAISLPFPAREGRYCRHYFVGGSSGPFGDEAPGEWQSLDIFRSYYLESIRDERGRYLSDANDWYDIHAKF